MSKALDPVTLEILWNGFRSVVDECFLTLMRSAFSTNIKERHDHSTAIADATGRLIVQADKALPIHLASMTGLMAALLRRHGGDIREGDLFVANDPHVGGGTHLPDINMAMPLFRDGRLIAFICNIAHHADVGGAARGSMSGNLFEIYQEGLRIPVVRLYNQGQLQQDVMDILLLNMRLPEERQGDLNAQIAACRLGVARLDQLIDKYDAGMIETGFDEILTRSLRRMRTAIAAIPDGRYEFQDVLDDDGIAAEDIPIVLAIDKAGTDIRFDFTGSADAVPGNVNLTLNAVQSAVGYALKALLDPDMPNNQSVLDAIEIVAPEGSLLNCQPPSAVALRANTSQRVIDVVIGALAPALPDAAIAAANGANTSAVFAGRDPETGKPYIYLETLGGGMGARAAADGKDGVQVHITNTSNLPVEAIEMEYPLRVLTYELIADSGGAGRHRGGMGLRRVIQPVGHETAFSGAGERFRHQPWGLFGGQAGASGRFRMRRGDGRTEALPHKVSDVAFGPDAAIIIETPGAGGYGDPASRDPALVEEDRRSGKFSDGYLAKAYGGKSDG
jgi:N-methylhydantoinase B